MKIAIPIDETRQGICASFARAPYVLLYETDSGTSEICQNPAAGAQGGAGLAAAQFLIDRGAGALITVRCGENAAQVLQEAGILLYQAQAGSAEDNLAALEEGKLAKLTDFHAGFHGGR